MSIPAQSALASTWFDLSDTERQVFNLVRYVQKKSVSCFVQPKIAWFTEKIKVGCRTIKRAIARLRDEGFLTTVFRGRKGNRYIVPDAVMLVDFKNPPKSPPEIPPKHSSNVPICVPICVPISPMTNSLSQELEDVRASSSLSSFAKEEGLDASAAKALEKLPPDKAETVGRRFLAQKAKGFTRNASAFLHWLIGNEDTYVERPTAAQKQAQELSKRQAQLTAIAEHRALAQRLADKLPADRFTASVSDACVHIYQTGTNRSCVIGFSDPDCRAKLMQWMKQD